MGARSTADRGRYQTIQQLIESIAPGTGTECPIWPPDPFAISASILAASGAYFQSVTVGTRDIVLEDSQTVTWAKYAQTIGEGWHRRLIECAKESFQRTNEPHRRRRRTRPSCAGVREDL